MSRKAAFLTAITAVGILLTIGIVPEARAQGRLFVANNFATVNGVDSVTVYPRTAAGDIPAMFTITAGIKRPFQIAIWQAAGELFVANYGNASVTVYDAETTILKRTIQGPSTGLDHPTGIAVDEVALELYVTNLTVPSVAVFDLAASGDVAPKRVITGPATTLASPAAIAVDHAHGEIVVVNMTASGGGSIAVFASAGAGDIAPLRTIQGTSTTLNAPGGVVLDPALDLIVVSNGVYASSPEGSSVLGFARGASGNVAPALGLQGLGTGLCNPAGVALDLEHNELFVANSRFANGACDESVTVYSWPAVGDQAPIRTLLGSGTVSGLAHPVGVALWTGTASLGDRVWQDNNADGVQDAGEPGVANATVNLYDCSGILKSTTTTDANGIYQFIDLQPGYYRVGFVLPPGFLAFSPQYAQGSDGPEFSTNNADSNADATGMTGCIPLALGQRNLTIDAGVHAGAARIKIVKYTNGDDADLPPGPTIPVGGAVTWTYVVTNTGDVALTNVTVTDSKGVAVTCPKSTLAVGEAMTCTASGIATLGQYANIGYVTGTPPTGPPVVDQNPSHYFGAGIPCSAAIGNFVWYDLNLNGIQDAGEPGIGGVTVNLEDQAGNVVATTTTAPDGTYQFGNLPCGDYVVEVVPPSDFVPTIDGAGSDRAKDSNASPAAVSLPTGGSDQTIDFGFVKKIDICPTGTTGSTAQMGTLYYSVDPATGNVFVRYEQARDVNDYSYGANTIGWGGPGKHKFSDLVGSDMARFAFKDATGKVVLDVQVDTISQKAGTPSGYASLGVTGGEGKVNVGSAANVIFATTGLDQNLNAYGYCAGGSCTFAGVNLLVDSPPTIGDPSYTLPAGSPFGNWNFTNSFTLQVRGASFGTAGFGSVMVTGVHNSPSKRSTGTPGICPTEGTGCAVTGTMEGSIDSGFNGTAIKAGNYVWFNSNFKISGLTTKTTVTFTGGAVTINGIAYAVPDATITFDPAVTCASTMFDGTKWVTTVPMKVSDETFISGVAVPFPSGLPGGAKVKWSGDFAADQPGVSISWKWSAAVYTSFTTDYNSVGVKPAHTNTCSYNNSDHAGTPENYKAYVVGGARGGGGSNWTGSWSGTQSIALCK